MLVYFSEGMTYWQEGKGGWEIEKPTTTVRSDVEERVAEERLAWNDKNIPAWPKNISVL